MKTLGLIGGMSWFSIAVYYKTINQLTNDRLGGANSAKLSALGIEPIIPDNEDRDFIHTSIFNEFIKGIYKKEIKKKYLHIIEKMLKDNAQGVIFGRTEISLLLNLSECIVSVFDTTAIHSEAAVDFALSTWPGFPLRVYYIVQSFRPTKPTHPSFRPRLEKKRVNKLNYIILGLLPVVQYKVPLHFDCWSSWRLLQ